MCINTHSSERMPRDFLIKYIESNSGEWMKTGTRADLHISGEWNTKRSNTHGRAEFTFVNGHDSNGKLTKIWKDKWRLPGNLLVRRYKNTDKNERSQIERCHQGLRILDIHYTSLQPTNAKAMTWHDKTVKTWRLILKCKWPLNIPVLAINYQHEFISKNNTQTRFSFQ